MPRPADVLALAEKEIEDVSPKADEDPIRYGRH